MARQELLTSDTRPEIWLVLNEAVIRRQVGGPDIMQQQLQRVIEAMALPNVTLQVIPFIAGAHSSMDGSFILLGFPEPTDPDVVYIEYQTGAIYLEKQDEVRQYRVMFDHLRASALPVDASRGLISGIADELA